MGIAQKIPGNAAVYKLPGKFNQRVSRPNNKYLGQAGVGAKKKDL
jgi:hypothetical protein